jgi:uncharacterized protein involved in exopolysaccharide biosynthesis
MCLVRSNCASLRRSRVSSHANRKQVGVEIPGLQADIANHRQRVASLRSMISTAPEVDAQFSRLDRDYSAVKAQYEALVEQVGRARLGEQAAQTGLVRFDAPPAA